MEKDAGRILIILALRHGAKRRAIHLTEITMGKGDTRTRRGKTNNHSYGKKRPHKIKKKAVATTKR
jgi:30S ribosomal protein S31